MLKIGLTGGIGCGKTTVANLFAEYGVPLIDTDVIARQLVEPGQPAFSRIVDHFGVEVLAGGQLDRARLRRFVFASRDERIWLENLLHPLIETKMQNQLKILRSPYCLLVIPLLVETGLARLVDRVLVVDTTPDLQRERACLRDGMNIELYEKILATQADRNSRLAAANDVIVNNGDFSELREQVCRLNSYYLSLSGLTGN